MFSVKVFTKPLQGLRGRGAEPTKVKKVCENLCNLMVIKVAKQIIIIYEFGFRSCGNAQWSGQDFGHP